MKKLLLILVWPWVLGCNFHEVESAGLYRSAQLDGAQLAQAIEKIGIKTVINLRGSNPGQKWYDEEKAVTERMGVRRYDIAMSAKRLPHRRDLIELLDAFRDAERPILIHCKQGADRTGEAAVLYKLLYMERSLADALGMLAKKYLHFTEFTPAKKYFVKEVWRGEDWARDQYDPCVSDYRYYDRNQDECTGKSTGRTILSADEDT